MDRKINELKLEDTKAVIGGATYSFATASASAIKPTNSLSLGATSLATRPTATWTLR